MLIPSTESAFTVYSSNCRRGGSTGAGSTTGTGGGAATGGSTVAFFASGALGAGGGVAGDSITGSTAGAGAGRDDIAALVFPNLDACRDLCRDAPHSDILADPKLRAHFATLLTSMAQAGTGSSTTIRRALLMAEPPSLDRAEMTDKGSINQRAVLGNRAHLVDEIYADPPSSRVIIIRE